MTLSSFFVLFGFVFSIGANERVNLENANKIIHVIGGANYRLNEDGVLVPAGMIVIGMKSLIGACKAGREFDSEEAEYDADEDDLYYTITNNTDSPVLVSSTSADMSGVLCATPFRIIESGQCLRVYENDRLHSLVGISVDKEVLCGGWMDDQPFCKLSQSYEITDTKEEGSFGYSSDNYNMRFTEASDRDDCKEIKYEVH